MRRRKIRVRRRGARSMRLAMLALLLALAVYLLSHALGLMLPGLRPEATKPTSGESGMVQASQATARVTEDIRFESLACYLVALSSQDSAEAARIEAGRYVRRGAAGYILEQGGKFLVIGACYQDQQEAETAAQRLSEQEGLAASAHALVSPPVALRVTAAKTQITALMDAEAALRELTGQLLDISRQLDSGAMETERAMSELAVLRARAELTVRALERETSEEQNSITRNLLMLSTELLQALRDRTNGSESTPLSFSAKIKYNTITIRSRHIAFLSELAA